MSNTLRAIMKYWTAPLHQLGGQTDLPFDIEKFCAENDAKLFELLKLQVQNEKLREQLREAYEVMRLDDSINNLTDRMAEWDLSKWLEETKVLVGEK